MIQMEEVEEEENTKKRLDNPCQTGYR